MHIKNKRGQSTVEYILLATAVVGDPETVRRGLEAFVAKHQPDEIMVTAQIFDHPARVRSFEIAALARDELLKAA